MGGISQTELSLLVPHVSAFHSPSAAFRKLFGSAADVAGAALKLVTPPDGKPLRTLTKLLLSDAPVIPVYSLEDSASSSVMERLSRLFPGFILFHDASFHSLVLSRYRDDLFPEGLLKELRQRFHSDLEIFGRTFPRGWSSEPLGRVGRWGLSLEEEGAPAIVTTKSLTDVMPSADYCPVPVCGAELDGTPAAERERFSRRAQVRQRLGIEASEIVVATAPRYALLDRLRLVQEVVATLRRSGVSIRLLRIGETSTGSSSEGTVDDGEICVTTESEQEGDSFLGASDVFVGLRADERHGLPYPVLRAMLAGLPAVVSQMGGAKDLPSNSAFHIRPGFTEERELAFTLEALASHRDLRESSGSRAAEYISQVHSPERVMESLTQIASQKLSMMLAAGKAYRTDSRRLASELLDRRLGVLHSMGAGLTPGGCDALLQAASDLRL